MPYAIVLHCASSHGPLRSADLQGQKTLALFLQELIQKQDPTVAARLHAPHHAKPFTTALLTPSEAINTNHHKRRATDTSTSNPSDPLFEVHIRLTLLDDMLYPLVSQFFLQHLGSMPLLWLGQSALSVSRVLATPESGEPWAGFARFEDLVAAASEVETAWTVHFATPTTFKAGEAELPLPIPRLCFQSWLNSWDEHAPCPFFPDRASRKAFLSEVVEGNVSVTYPRLQLVQHTLYFDGTRIREQGFVGTCRFAVRPTRVAPQYRRLLATLARYSYYAGTGRKTTMGMGMTRYMQKDHSECLTP
jgi:CRISPR-associated endoribonuclease Cas6